MNFPIIGGFKSFNEDRQKWLIAIEVAGRKNEDGSNNPVFVTETQFEGKTDGMFTVNDLAGSTLVVEFYRKGEMLPARDGDEEQEVTDSGIIVKSFSFMLAPHMLLAKMQVAATLRAQGLSFTTPAPVSTPAAKSVNETPADDSKDETPELEKATEEAQK